MILKLCLSRALGSFRISRQYWFAPSNLQLFWVPLIYKMSALEQDPLGTFSRVLCPEDQKKKKQQEWKENNSSIVAKSGWNNAKIDACDVLEESSRYKCIMIMISLLDTWRKRGYRENCQLVHLQDNWASASLLHFRHFTVYSSPVDTLLKCCGHSVQKYGQQLNPN